MGTKVSSLVTGELEDITAIINSLSGQNDEPSNGAAWLGEGRVEIRTEDGTIGYAVHTEDDGWMFQHA